MKIQDVEQKTNLSKKAIRYYEEKELIYLNILNLENQRK